MKHSDQVIDTYSQLSNVEMPPDKNSEIWSQIQSAIENERIYDTSHCDGRIQSRNGGQWRKWVAGTTASIAGICVVLLFAFVIVVPHHSIRYSFGSSNTTQNSQEPPVKPSEVAKALGKSELQLRATSGIVTTASAFDGKKNIKFRLMVYGTPSKKEATKLFDDILTTVQENSHNKDIWSYYNGQFDIKNYTTGVVYTATKKAGQPIVIDKNVQKSG